MKKKDWIGDTIKQVMLGKVQSVPAANRVGNTLTERKNEQFAYTLGEESALSENGILSEIASFIKDEHEFDSMKFSVQVSGSFETICLEIFSLISTGKTDEGALENISDFIYLLFHRFPFEGLIGLLTAQVA